jgi:hypothetical protein
MAVGLSLQLLLSDAQYIRHSVTVPTSYSRDPTFEYRSGRIEESSLLFIPLS